MKMYADTPARRTRQIVADLLVVLWVVFWVWAGWSVHEATQELARPAERTQAAATGLAGSLRDTGDSLGGIPLIGDSAVRAPGRRRRPRRRPGGLQRQGMDSINSLALKLGLVVALTPMVIVFAFFLPPRWAFVRNATAGQRFVDSQHDVDLFAMRALANQPLHLLARISPDPAGAWRARDPQVVARLAALEMHDVGLRPPSWLGAGPGAEGRA